MKLTYGMGTLLASTFAHIFSYEKKIKVRVLETEISEKSHVHDHSCLCHCHGNFNIIYVIVIMSLSIVLKIIKSKDVIVKYKVNPAKIELKKKDI